MDCCLAGWIGTSRDLAQSLMSFSALLGVLQNDAVPMIIDHGPFFDLFQGSKAAEAGEIVVQAAISDAGGLREAVDITH